MIRNLIHIGKVLIVKCPESWMACLNSEVEYVMLRGERDRGGVYSVLLLSIHS